MRSYVSLRDGTRTLHSGPDYGLAISHNDTVDLTSEPLLQGPGGAKAATGHSRLFSESIYSQIIVNQRP